MTRTLGILMKKTKVRQCRCAIRVYSPRAMMDSSELRTTNKRFKMKFLKCNMSKYIQGKVGVLKISMRQWKAMRIGSLVKITIKCLDRSKTNNQLESRKTIDMPGRREKEAWAGATVVNAKENFWSKNQSKPNIFQNMIQEWFRSVSITLMAARDLKTSGHNSCHNKSLLKTAKQISFRV